MDELTRKIFETFQLFRKIHMYVLLPENLSRNEYFTLMSIEHLRNQQQEGHVSISMIAKILHVTTPAVSRTIHSLEEHEYLLRENDKNDRRNTFVKLTPKGNDILKQAHVQMSNFLNQMVHDLCKEDKEHLIHCMQQMYSNATAEIERMEHEKRNEKPQKIEIK